uniref:Mob1/phocein family protein n=1 Tax=Aplanochytrium stocchinoi TaxID=215587 RepID=A0A7S3V049_9STRA|mmetsp:Transcript_9001/g.10483  ORF Transcript_9001/g.10483 Transcript_9001/m.10483 type:complete len:221 (+) Transcript_9001:382-1044(+)
MAETQKEKDWNTGGASGDVSIPHCPEGEDLNEYIASSTIAFYNDLVLLYESVIVDSREKYTRPGQGFPPGFIYYWTEDAESGEEVPAVPAPGYMEKCLNWIDQAFNDETVFPTDATIDWPTDFLDNHICRIFTYMFRTFAILYHCHYELLVQNKVANLLNTTLKHFVFFSIRYNLLIDEEELLALATPVEKIKKEYIKAWNKSSIKRKISQNAKKTLKTT